MTDLRVDEFDYHLPTELIAQTPLTDRTASRLLVVDPMTEEVIHSTFRELGSFLTAGDLLVFNNSRVIPARLYGQKSDTGARIEILLLQPQEDGTWTALAKPAKRLRVGTRIHFTDASLDGGAETSGAFAEVVEVGEEGIRRLKFHVEGDFYDFLDQVGTMPLPHYIHEPLTDSERYQTVYADPKGSVAAPTAGLHFTEALIEELRQMGVETAFVTLHVGIGTFRPVQVEVVEDHPMHMEVYEVGAQAARQIERAKSEGRRVIAVGTTALRTLESAGETGKVRMGQGETEIFIYPGYKFRVVDALITNFHLPKSTLFMLVSAMMGTEFAKHVYAQAVIERYRFFSFGDAMLIQRGRSN